MSTVGFTSLWTEGRLFRKKVPCVICRTLNLKFVADYMEKGKKKPDLWHMFGGEKVKPSNPKMKNGQGTFKCCCMYISDTTGEKFSFMWQILSLFFQKSLFPPFAMWRRRIIITKVHAKLNIFKVKDFEIQSSTVLFRQSYTHIIQIIRFYAQRNELKSGVSWTWQKNKWISFSLTMKTCVGCEFGVIKIT